MSNYTPTPEEIARRARKVRGNRADARRAKRVAERQAAVAAAIEEDSRGAARNRRAIETTQNVYVGSDARAGIIDAARFFISQGNLIDGRLLARTLLIICLRNLFSINAAKNSHLDDPAVLALRLRQIRAIDKPTYNQLLVAVRIVDNKQPNRLQLNDACKIIRETLFALQRDDAEIYKQARIQPRAILIDGRQA